MNNNEFRIDVWELVKISVDVGVSSKFEKDENDNYSEQSCENYENLRLKQLKMFEDLIKKYTK